MAATYNNLYQVNVKINIWLGDVRGEAEGGADSNEIQTNPCNDLQLDLPRYLVSP